MRMDSQNAMLILQSALASHQQGDLRTAEDAYRGVLAVHPNHPDALHLLGVIAIQCGHAHEGEQLIRRAIAQHSAAAEFHEHLADALVRQSRFPEAAASYLDAARLAPDAAAHHFRASSALMAAGQVTEGIDQLRIAAELDPADTKILANYANALASVGQTDDAVRVLREATTTHPNHPTLWAQLGETLWRAGDFDQALSCVRQATELNPRDVPTMVLLGAVLQTLAQFEDAAGVYRRAAVLDPTNVDARSNLALTLLKMGEAEQSLAEFDEVVARWPDNADARANRSLALLTLGNFEQGWEAYEVRWQSMLTPQVEIRHRPRWDGADPAGQTVLLTTEQGLGDTVQLVRYASLIRDLGARVIVAAAPELKPLIATVPGVAAVVTPGEAMPDFDVFAPLASLPRVFKTTLVGVPADVPYVRAERERVDHWRARLAGDPNVKVGLVWAGASQHLNDRARSARLADFAPLSAVDGVTFYALQKGPPALQPPPDGMQLVSVGDALHDFGDTAALLDCLDLLIAVDTSVIHVAGAMARPVWTLLAKGPDWRWMLRRNDTPWYPTMRLFRQQRSGDWASVMSTVADQLRSFVRGM